ncbi:hypothetical protein OAE74_00880, partial [Verrucomicrobia bacterium]|nr:hypothetical protein [Verrucomicrobiota bacterium]
IEADTNFRVCKKVKPKNLEQLSAVVAIARPGALDFADQYASYSDSNESQIVHDFFEEELSYTGGIPLYQEQLMKMAVRIGFTLDESEQLRRIVGKKKVDQMPAWKQKIKDKIEERKLDPKIGDVLWKVAEDSANYSFNKSHSISYAILAAWTAYLKFKYPKQFFLSLLKLSKYEPDSHTEISKISQELQFFDMKLLAPDLAKSEIDFSIEGDDIRFGLNAVKGVSEKSLEALQNFRESETPTKFDIFISAKQAGINIGLLSALIQAGTLSSYKTNRTRLVLEAQAFNVLTDKEKSFACQVGKDYDYDILNIVYECGKIKKTKRDDGRPFMTEKRYATFVRKYTNYKKIYEQNKKYENFANWVYENNLLGYTPSTKLKTVFNQNEDTFTDCLELMSVFSGDKVKIVSEVEDVYKGKTRKDNSVFYKFQMKDEAGRTSALFMDTKRGKNLSNYINNGNQIPEKGDIVVFTGRKGDDIVWLEKMTIQNDRIFMKLSDLK